MRLAAFVVMLMPSVALAQGALPPQMMQAVKSDPSAWLQDVAALIGSAGQDGAVTADQLAVAVAVKRAAARVAAMEPLMAADLDGDGMVTRDEVTGAGHGLAAGAQAALQADFAAADGNGDGKVSKAELVALGDAAALSAMGPARLAEVKVLMGFDADGDGRVTLDEVKAGLQALVS